MKTWLQSLFIYPLIAFLLLFGSLFAIYTMTIHNIKHNLVQQEIQHAKEDIFLLKSMIDEYSFQKKPELIQREIVRFATKKYVHKVFLIDLNHTIHYTNRAKYRDEKLDHVLNSKEKISLAKIMHTKHFNIQFNKELFLNVIQPLEFFFNPVTKKLEKGYLVIEYDFSSLIEQQIYMAQKTFLLLFLAITFLFLLFSLFVYKFLLKNYYELGKLLFHTDLYTTIPINKFIQTLKESIEKIAIMEKVFQNSEDAILITDGQKRIITVNPAFEKISGYKKEEVLGKKPEEILKSGLQNEAFYEHLWRNLTKRGKWSGEIIDKRKNGNKLYALIHIFSIKDPITGTITNYAAVIKDITELAKKQEIIQNLAFYDPLTNLANRAKFLHTLEEFIALGKRKEFHFAILFIDLDNFKEINDTLGHDIGDKLLQEFAKRIKNELREEDIAARQGGDEFVILLPNVSSGEAALEVACRLKNSFEEPVAISSHSLTISFSIGIALFPQDAKNAIELLKAADIAMYKAKEKRNNCILFQEKMQSEALEKLILKKELQQAIANNELILYLQPKISKQTHQVKGFEALIRWIHPKKGFIPPFKFIPLAEESTLIIPLTEWIFQEVNSILDKFQQENIQASIAINISARHFATKQLIKQITTNIKKEYIQRGLIELEVTESAVMEDINKAMHYLQELHSFGIKVSLDDFGTGYSSLQYLKKLPIDTIKIDKIFIDHIIDDNKDQAIVESTIEMADKLGMDTVAEGVETKEQAQFLEQIGIDYIQGYYYAKPMPFEEVLQFLKK
ncbi:MULTISPECIES: bifunctional diguanylate cyclase/phosphodiesterase [unclassified Nitratiruptor]|uniref:putative bifunctional diguanylate cyclase/phosphodiesterase n=1 Tax=unclassified Nitratiruptor TaxID=2624044 RepID=UPI0019169125|nr:MULTISPECIES: EAL domain-containing protein [unclassified Nitratiruptor]BCD61038.1 diguanylate cyclase/phosphodiesterase [Nitratiruptor sp. YY08-10]BCD64970.1 diguanylate cyclase/phosphodiesterase [Nitratiruptor sp. YY08-14]